jgi:hypothetical protein
VFSSLSALWKVFKKWHFILSAWHLSPPSTQISDNNMGILDAGFVRHTFFKDMEYWPMFSSLI